VIVSSGRKLPRPAIAACVTPGGSRLATRDALDPADAADHAPVDPLPARSTPDAGADG
jgi:hypothetical protein